MRSFVDSDVLVYADDSSSPEKRQRSQALIESLLRSGNGLASLQTLREYFFVATRKLGVPADLARRKVEIYSQFELVTSDLEDLFAAIDLHRLHGLSLWDALIVRSALVGRCAVLYSEDLQHGRRFGSLAIENPFLATKLPARPSRRRKH